MGTLAIQTLKLTWESNSKQETAWQKLLTACHLKPRRWSSPQYWTYSRSGWLARHVARNLSRHVIVLRSVSKACNSGRSGFHLRLKQASNTGMHVDLHAHTHTQTLLPYLPRPQPMQKRIDAIKHRWQILTRNSSYGFVWHGFSNMHNMINTPMLCDGNRNPQQQVDKVKLARDCERLCSMLPSKLSLMCFNPVTGIAFGKSLKHL